MGLHTKLVEVMKRCAYAQKANEARDYNYVSDEQFMRLINPALCDAGISCTVYDTQLLHVGKVTTAKGSEWNHAIVKVTLELTDAESGESAQLEGIGEGTDSGDKAVYKAQTGARKYAWRMALNIATGDDPEADRKTDDSFSPKKERAVAKPKQTEMEVAFEEKNHKADALLFQIKSMFDASGSEEELKSLKTSKEVTEAIAVLPKKYHPQVAKAYSDKYASFKK